MVALRVFGQQAPRQVPAKNRLRILKAQKSEDIHIFINELNVVNSAFMNNAGKHPYLFFLGSI